MAALAVTAGARQPSYPDRARIDSDVRYLLRAPSTPWITFDKDEPQIGSLLASARSSVSSEAGFFPEPPPVAAPLVPAVEPSNVIVSADIQAEPLRDLEETHDSVAIPVASPRRIGVAVGCALGLALLIAGTAWSLGGKTHATTKATAAAQPQPAIEQTAEPAAPRVDLPPPPPTSEPATTAAKPDKPEKKGFGRLVVRGAAKNNRVYLDGKLLLGQGQRTFMVFCGEHTIAVGNKADPRDVDVPCNGELVVSK